MRFIFRSLAVFLLSCLSVSGVWSQSLGVNNSGAPAHSSSILDVSSTDKGMLIPRMTKAQKNAIASPATGLLVFQTSPDSVGFHYYDGAVWTWLANANKALDSTAWLTTGNTGLNDTSFLGHRDNKPVMFRSNNLLIGRLNSFYSNYAIGLHAGASTGVGHIAMGDSAGAVISNNFPGAYLGYLSGRVNTGGNNAFFGAWSGSNNTTGFLNFFGGTSSGYQNTTGNANTYLGHFAGYDNQTGSSNVAIGYRALKTYTGSNVTAVGYKALDSLTTGTRATAVGFQALMQNTSGDRNTAVGYRSLDSNKIGNYNTALGYGTLFRNRSSFNTAIGENTMVNNTNGDANTIVGAESMIAQNTTGRWNTSVGVNNFFENTTGSFNTATGFQSLLNNTTGNGNTATGIFSMFDNRNGTFNVAYGYDALARSDSGSNNVAVGVRSQYAHNRPFSSYNVSIGNYSLENDTLGYYNVALGTSTLRLSRNSIGNTAVGTNALYNHANGDYNTAVGFESMPEDTSGSLNTAIGWRSLRLNRAGSENTALGVGTLEFMDSTVRNTAVGRGAMIGVPGSKLTADNVAVGFYAGGVSDSARRATMIGRTAGYNNEGDENVFVGYNSGYGALSPGLTGIENTGLGAQTLVHTTTGRSNTATGMGALYLNQTGSNNTAVGVRSMVNSAAGNRNAALGDSSLMFNNGDENTVAGHKAMQFNNSGSENVAIGKFSLQSNTIGIQNTAIGTNAGISNSAGNLVTMLGYNSNPSSGGLVNATALGARAFVSQSNSLVLGSINGLNGATSTVNVGIGLTNPSARLHVRRNGTGTGPYHPSSSLILEDISNSYIHMVNPSVNETGLLSGTNLTNIRSALIFSIDSSLYFRTGGNTTRMILDNSGNVGIGTLTPLKKVHIVGPATEETATRIASTGGFDAGLELVKTGGGGSDWKIRVDAAGYLSFSRASNDFATTPTDYYEMITNQFRPVADASASLGAAGNRWTTVFATNGTINTSDAREKENIEALNYGLRELMQLRPVSYTWKKNPEWGKKIGFIAQEVQPILKEVVQKGSLPEKEKVLDDQGKPVNPDNDRLGIYYSDIIPVTVKAIQEQQQQIEQQQKIIEELRSQNKALENDLKAIKQKLGIQ